MNVKMFTYLEKQNITKAISKYFSLKKYNDFKIAQVTNQEKRDFGFVCASYDAKTRTIRIDSRMWEMSTYYEQYELLVHEMVHVYQHHYGLCPFDYDKAYNDRPQEIHANTATSAILQLLNITKTESLFD